MTSAIDVTFDYTILELRHGRWYRWYMKDSKPVAFILEDLC